MGRGLLGRWKDAEQKKALLANKTFRGRLEEAGFEDDDLKAMDIDTISKTLEISNKLDTAIGKQEKKGLEDLKTDLETTEKSIKFDLLKSVVDQKLGEDATLDIIGQVDNEEEFDQVASAALLEDATQKRNIAEQVEINQEGVSPEPDSGAIGGEGKELKRVGTAFIDTKGDLAFTPSELERQQDEIKAEAALRAKIGGEVGSQEGKKGREKARNFKRVEVKMSQAMGLLGKVYKRGQEGTGGLIRGGHGLQGIALGAVVRLQDMANINKFYAPYMGHINMAGMAMMRMQFPGRSKELVELTLTTVPKPTGNPHKDIVQSAESFIDNFNETIVTAVDEFGEPKFSPEEEKQMKTAYRATIYGQLVQGMVESGVIRIEELDDDEYNQLVAYRNIVKGLQGGE